MYSAPEWPGSSGAVAVQAIPPAAWPAGLNIGVCCITPSTVPSTPEGMARFVLAGPGLTDRTVTLPFLSADDDGRRGWWAGLPGGAACWLVGLAGPLPWLPVSLGRCRGSGPVPRDGVR
jgi:hypothetical protein